MKADAKPSRYGINGAVMDNPEMSDALRAEYENPAFIDARRTHLSPSSIVALYALGAFFVGLAWAQHGAWDLPIAPGAYTATGALLLSGAALLRWRWEQKAD